MLALAATHSPEPACERVLLTDHDLSFARTCARIHALAEGTLGRAPDDEESTLAEQARGELAYDLGLPASKAWSLAMLYGYSRAKARARKELGR